MLLLSNEDVTEVLTMPVCIDAMEQAFGALATGGAIDRPRSNLIFPVSSKQTYMLKSFDGGIQKLEVAASRLNSEIVHYQELDGELRRDKVPAAPGNRFVGLVVLFSTQTCEPLAIMPDGYMQAFRVAATYALGTKYMARKDSRTLGIYGCGLQARAAVQAQCLVRPFREVRVYSPTRAHREKFAQEMQPLVKITVQPVEQPPQVMQSADVVISATNSLTPVIHGGEIEKGMHLSDLNNAFDQEVFRRIDLWGRPGGEPPANYVCGRTATQELARTSGSTDKRLRQGVKLEDMIVGREEGRTKSDQVTAFGAGTGEAGRGIQFAAVGYYAFEEAKRRGLGRELPTEWFTQSIHS